MEQARSRAERWCGPLERKSGPTDCPPALLVRPCRHAPHLESGLGNIIKCSAHIVRPMKAPSNATAVS